MTVTTTTTIERAWLEWLVKVRIIVITLLLGVELAVATLTNSHLPKGLFVVVIIVGYAVAALHGMLLAIWRDDRFHAIVQVLTDLAFVTAILYVTGGADSSFNFLYPLIIIVASILLPQRWTYFTSLLAFILFGAVVELSYFGVIHSYATSKPDLKSLQAIIFINLGAYVAVAYLASLLSAKFRQVRVQLQDKSGALESLQVLHENIVHSVSGGLITTGQEDRISLVNPAAERMLERPADELIGQPISRFLGQTKPDASRFETECETPSGRKKFFGLTVTPLRVSGRGNVGLIYSFTDLTEIRRLEAEVRLRDRMAAVGRMAAGIAHEIRNPLSSLAGSAQMLRDSSGMDPDQRLLLDIIKRESERLNLIVTDFLAYSRQHAYRLQFHDLVALLQDTVTLLKNRPEFTGENPALSVDLRFEVEHAWAEVDSDRIKQVFWNICDNAVRAMSKGGTLTVRVCTSGDYWRIGFADTGTGFGTQLQEKIFEPFQSAFDSGTGLGLAIVYQIVQAHEGRIEVQSVPGNGTEFTVELKRAAQSAPAAAGGASRG